MDGNGNLYLPEFHIVRTIESCFIEVCVYFDLFS